MKRQVMETKKHDIYTCDVCGKDDIATIHKCIFCGKDMCYDCSNKHNRIYKYALYADTILAQAYNGGICPECAKIGIPHFRKMRNDEYKKYKLFRTEASEWYKKAKEIIKCKNTDTQR